MQAGLFYLFETLGQITPSEFYHQALEEAVYGEELGFSAVCPAEHHFSAHYGIMPRVELFLSLLGLSNELIDVDLANGEHKTQTFLNKNHFGQVPVIDDAGVLISDSNAILVYLARKYDPRGQWLPDKQQAWRQGERHDTRSGRVPNMIRPINTAETISE